MSTRKGCFYTCPLSAKCTVWRPEGYNVSNRGRPDAPVVVVGEAPGFHEEKEGAAFVGRSGKVLDEVLGYAGFDLRDVLVLNSVKCRPLNNRTPTEREIDLCVDKWLSREIAQYPRKIIIAMGNSAVYALGLTKKVSGVMKLRGTVQKTEYSDAPVVVTVHPAAVLRNPRFEDQFCEDFKFAATVYSSGGSSLPEICIRHKNQFRHSALSLSAIGTR